MAATRKNSRRRKRRSTRRRMTSSLGASAHAATLRLPSPLAEGAVLCGVAAAVAGPAADVRPGQQAHQCLTAGASSAEGGRAGGGLRGRG